MPSATPPQNGPSGSSMSIDPALGTGERAEQPERDGMERDVSNILAALNQAELAKIVAAARAAEAKGRGSSEASAADHPEAATLPPGLGQAASALTSIASASSSFKRTPGTAGANAGKDADDAPSSNADYMNEDSKDLDAARTSAAIAAAKSATDSATAAAIASLGSLAAASNQAHDADDSELYDRSESPSSPHGLKRPRGPEMDRQRKDNHKEVERRRRSAINDGIINLSHIVPGCDSKNTNKGAIIHAAVRYIQDLKHNEASNIEKWTLEKLLMDQAMGDLNSQLDELRRENERIRAALEDNAYAAHDPDPPPTDAK